MKTNLVNEFKGSFLDYPSKDGMCLSLYFTGCLGICPGCHNKELQDPNFGAEFSISKLINIIPYEAERLRTNKITLLGGDPLYPKNLEFVKELLIRLGNEFDFCVYTGYDLAYVKLNNVKNFKYLKTGLYNEYFKQESVKTDDYFQLASSNQEIYDRDFNLLSTNGRMIFNTK